MNEGEGWRRLDLIVATWNRGKIREIRKALEGLGFRVRGLSDFSDVPKIEEDGKSFAENALKKARFYAEHFGKLTIADDSGLEVDALKGAPGIYSARYAGPGSSDRANTQKLLKAMEGIPASRRRAKFRCSVAIVRPDGNEAVVHGACAGRIGLKEVGKRGFGYDPVFMLAKYGRSMAQLGVEEKNRISHRGKALRKLGKIIRGFVE